MTTSTGVLITLAAIFSLGFLTTISMWIAAAFHGWQFHCRFEKLQKGCWTIRPFSIGKYDTGWFADRKFGDGKPDPRKPGHMIANAPTKRAKQWGLDIILLKWTFVCAITKDEIRQ